MSYVNLKELDSVIKDYKRRLIGKNGKIVIQVYTGVGSSVIIRLEKYRGELYKVLEIKQAGN